MYGRIIYICPIVQTEFENQYCVNWTYQQLCMEELFIFVQSYKLNLKTNTVLTEPTNNYVWKNYLWRT